MSAEGAWEPADSRYEWKLPPLLQTCRQIRAEATGIYLGGNGFSFDDKLSTWHVTLKNWLCLLDKDAVKYLEDLEVDPDRYHEATHDVMRDLSILWSELQQMHAAPRKDAVSIWLPCKRSEGAITADAEHEAAWGFMTVEELGRGSIVEDKIWTGAIRLD